MGDVSGDADVPPDEPPAGPPTAGQPAGPPPLHDRDEVVLDVAIDDEGHSGRGRLTVLRLSWRADDALAVALHLSAQPAHPALPRGQWVVLRDFLRYGLEQHTGDGAVRIWPDELRDRVWFELERYGRPACVSIPRDGLRDFLDRTDQQVPSGLERSEQALEDLLTRLLRSYP